MEQTPDQEPGGFETGSELRREPPIPPPATSLPDPDPPRSSRRVWAAALAVLVVGLLAYLLLTLL